MDGSKKPFFLSLDNDVFVIILIVFIAFTSFGVGRLSTHSTREQEKTPILFSHKITVPFDNKQASYEPQSLKSSVYGSLDNSPQPSSIVVSKNGTKYHFPWCSGAKRIKEENKIWFDNEQEAQEAGYTPAANCKGLK